jgi:hypothetical protein
MVGRGGTIDSSKRGYGDLGTVGQVEPRSAAVDGWYCCKVKGPPITTVLATRFGQPPPNIQQKSCF